MIKQRVLFSAIFVLLPLALLAQPAHPRQSPIDIARTTIDDTYVKVTYGKPFKRERVVFGELVPYGAVWRTGANEATEIVFTGDVVFGGKEVKAGIYSLYSIPKENSWTLIINSQLGAWGAIRYNQELDVVRIDVPVRKLDEIMESFTIRFETSDTEPRTKMTLSWDSVAVDVEVQKK